jgi:N6-adenosine-specific RNA methylase IME4
MSTQETLAFPNKKYSVILADPPWSFKVWSDKGKGRSAERHYSVMPKSEIQALPIREIATADCILFLWVTAPCLIEGIELIKAWGFEYKTIAFTWVKRNKISDTWFMGMGYWTRANAELCLLATRGKPKRVNAGVHSIVDSRIRRHSQKPDEVRDRIVSLMGDVPRIELFARERADGWDAWGDEIND